MPAQPQKIPDGAEKFRASPKYIQLRKAIPNIDQLLQENKAIIAGSSVLNPLVENSSIWKSDIDIYVPIPNDKTVHDLFRHNPALIESAIERYGLQNVKSSSYCSSFMKRNGIRTVVKYHTRQPGVDRWDQLDIDIMAVRKRTNPLNVVQNFDLTFCQVWYDGVDVWATHPSHITEKKGLLQGEYVPIYLTGNQFLRKRMQKYVDRGFRVGADPEGKELTTNILHDFGSMPNSCRNTKFIIKENGIPWARKTMFRACFGYTHYKGANEYSKEEDGYDSDEYAEDPTKLVNITGSMDELIRKIKSYLLHVNLYFDSTVCDHLEEYNIMENFLNPLISEIKQLCGPRYRILTGSEPEIYVCSGNYRINYNGNSGNSPGSYGNIDINENYENYGNNENNYETNEALLRRVPAIPPEMNRELTTRPTGVPGVTECYDPYMASTVDIAENQVIFYIFGKPVGNESPPFIKAACIDNETEDQGQQIKLYRKFLDDITYIYYQCKPTVPPGSLFIRRQDTTKEPLRRLAFDSNIYVYESQAKKIQAGRKYALIPTDTKLGRIVSETLIQTGNAVGAEHCQTDYSDKIHEIFEMVPVAQGGMRFRPLANKRRKTSKQNKYRKSYKLRKQTRLRRK